MTVKSWYCASNFVVCVLCPVICSVTWKQYTTHRWCEVWYLLTMPCLMMWRLSLQLYENKNLIPVFTVLITPECFWRQVFCNVWLNKDCQVSEIITNVLWLYPWDFTFSFTFKVWVLEDTSLPVIELWMVCNFLWLVLPTQCVLYIICSFCVCVCFL